MALTDMRTFLRTAASTSAPLTIFAVLMFVSFIATLIGAFVEPKVITGAPAWLKPAKFSISFCIYCLTLAWLLSHVEKRPRLVTMVANVTVITAAIEMVIIIAQVFRNTTSHFNLSTPLNTVLFSAMGVTIVVLWVMTLLTAIMLIRQRITDTVFAWGLRLGVLVTLVGLALGFLMTSHQTAQQAEIAKAGKPMMSFGAHSFGIEDGGPGLPFVGWNKTGGDLRPAHFIGLHAMQILPLLGWFFSSWRKSKLNEDQRLKLIWTFGATYLGVLTLLTWQALRGQSIVSPDYQTAAAFATLIVATTLASIGITRMRLQTSTPLN